MEVGFAVVVMWLVPVDAGVCATVGNDPRTLSLCATVTETLAAAQNFTRLSGRASNSAKLQDFCAQGSTEGLRDIESSFSIASHLDFGGTVREYEGIKTRLT